MAVWGSKLGFCHRGGSDWFRRVSLIPVRPGEGRLTEPTAVIRSWRRERVFMPHKRPCRRDQGTVQAGRRTKPDLGRPDPDRRGCAETGYSPGLAPRGQRKAAIILPWRRTAPDAFAPTAAAVRRQRPRIEAGDGTLLLGSLETIRHQKPLSLQLGIPVVEFAACPMGRIATAPSRRDRRRRTASA